MKSTLSILPSIMLPGENNISNIKRNPEEYNPFRQKVEKIVEIKIFLKYNFHKSDIDDNFLADLDLEYAIKYLEKIGLLPTSSNISKLLKIRPIDKCDFSLTVEQIRNKPIKLLHIYPNPKHVFTNTSQKLKKALSNDEFERIMSKTALSEVTDDKITQIKRREISKDELFLQVPELIENMFHKAKENIQDKKLYLQSDGNIKNQAKVFDLNIDNIREKFIKLNSQTIVQDSSLMKSKAKFQNIDKASKIDILENKKFEYPYLDVNLNKENLTEINKPIDIPLEVILKDINYILDNFPIDQLIHLEEPIKRSHIVSEKNQNDEKNKYYKIKLVSKKDILFVYKKIQSNEIYKIIGLLINLIYWIVFGYMNRIQIDKHTKEHILFKILEELQNVEIEFGNKKIFHKLFMPILILVIRIECEAIFQKKFQSIFESKENLNKALMRTNEIITIIFDPNCYFNTFTMLSLDFTKIKHKLSKNLYPKYKSKINATSNMLNQLFSKYSDSNSKVNEENRGSTYLEEKDWQEEAKYIIESKKQFYKVMLSKINQNLKKRNLDPIFEISKEK